MAPKQTAIAVTDMTCPVCNFILLSPNIHQLGRNTNTKNGLTLETADAECHNCGSKYRIIAEQVQGPTRTDFRIRDINRT